mgnify:CR=1 FL=1
MIKESIKQIELSAQGEYKVTPCTCSSEANMAKRALKVIKELEKEIERLSNGT